MHTAPSAARRRLEHRPQHRLPHRPFPTEPATPASRHRHWAWLAAGLFLFFLIPFVLTDLASMDRDLYYGLYVGAVFGFVGLWLRYGMSSARAVLTRNWRAGLALGVVFIGGMTAIVLQEPATSRPDGLELAAAVAWRGVVYGLADGLILSAFPILAVFAAFAGTPALARWRGKVAVGALALAVSLLFTAVYHVGYADFRGEKVRKPLVGDVVWSIPTLVTLSPLASPITHAGLHVTAVVHSYDTDLFLPPHAGGLDPAALQRVLDQAVTGSTRIAPGATAFVSTPEGTWTGAAGLADVRTGAAMTPEARMRLESVSKIYTAVLIHQLAEEGRLGLSHTVERWLPGTLPEGDRITLAQLLTHTSGLVDNNDVVRDAERFIARVDDPAVRAQFLALRREAETNPNIEFPSALWVQLATYQPLLHEPGRRFHYSNIGFDLLGLVASRVTGEPLETLYRERIFEPLGLEQTAFDPQGPISGAHARGYNIGARGERTDATAGHGGIGADGGIVSNAAETATFLTALMQGELLGPSWLERMKTTTFWRDGEPTSCGVAYGHSGAGFGFKTNVWVSGDGERVGVLLLNGRVAESDRGDAAAGDALGRLYCPAEATR